jgi:hypothetical protein
MKISTSIPIWELTEMGNLHFGANDSYFILPKLLTRIRFDLFNISLK